MSELDFSKIFGETATSKASFTDENYLNGWGYLGSTPPPYQLFDYLQSLNDKKAKYLYDSINENKNNLLTHNANSSAHNDIRQKFNNYLPLTGGTVTGPIVGNVKGNADTATKATNDGNGANIATTYLKKAGDTVSGSLNVPTQPVTDNSTKVANTEFVNSARTPILNAIKAISGMSAYDDAPSKTIATMIPLLGFGGIVAQKLESTGYVKFANGVCIQWGDLANGAGTFPTSFSTTVFFAVATSNTVNSTWGRPVIPMKPVTTLTGVSFTGYISSQEDANTWSTSGFNGRYFCIGI